jgi:aryl-alcohol dehydrogenase-like predicted oxidoreductase
MRYLEVGGTRLSAVGLGTWQFGSREWGYGADYAQREAAEILTRALELGVNVVDTAEIYGFGQSERIVGRAIESRRSEVFLATKLFPVLPVPQVVRWRLRGSLRRLGVDHVDLYQAHWPNPVVPPGPLFHTLAALQAEGKITHVGVSNYSLDQWQTAERLLGGPVLSNQVEYNLVQRRAERELLPWASAQDRLIIAYSPLAQGFLSGRYAPDHLPGGVRAANTLFLPENLRRAAPLIDALRRVAVTHDARTSQVALAWLLRRANVIVIPGARSVAQLEANVAAADLDLSASDDEELTSVAEAFTPVSGLPAAADLARTRVQALRPRRFRR